MRLLVVAAALFAVAGCLDVDSPDGTLLCSSSPSRPCPSGFYCLQPDNTCWRDGHYPGDMAEPVQILPPPPPSGGELDMSIPVEDDLAVPPLADLASTD